MTQKHAAWELAEHTLRARTGQEEACDPSEKKINFERLFNTTEG
jgi:hypothetical protein